jgi:hypothetical protein
VEIHIWIAVGEEEPEIDFCQEPAWIYLCDEVCLDCGRGETKAAVYY